MEFILDPKGQATEILFFCKKNGPNHPLVFFTGTVVPTVSKQKDLQLVLDSKLLIF